MDISEAIVKNLSRHPFWTDDARAALCSEIGDAGVLLVDEIVNFAVAQEDLWRHQSYEDAVDEVNKRLNAKYSQLNCAAIERLARMAAYEWK